VDEPKKNIPRGQVSCVVTLFFTSMLVLIISAALPPGLYYLQAAATPFNIGYGLMFKTASVYLTILSVPATFATAFGFIYSYGRLLVAMGDSKLIPSFLSLRYEPTGAPWAAYLFGSVIGYITSLCAYYYPNDFAPYIFNICLLGACMSYSAQCVGYISLNTRFSTIPREFRSPFSYYGAGYALFISVMTFISLAGFQGDGGFSITFFVVLLILLTTYYHLYACKRQTISEDERKVLFVAHVINNNLNKKNAGRRKSKPARNGSSKSLSVKNLLPWLSGSSKSRKSDPATDQQLKNGVESSSSTQSTSKRPGTVRPVMEQIWIDFAKKMGWRKHHSSARDSSNGSGVQMSDKDKFAALIDEEKNIGKTEEANKNIFQNPASLAHTTSGGSARRADAHKVYVTNEVETADSGPSPTCDVERGTGVH